MREKISIYFEMMKPRISLLALLTGYLGYYLGLRYQNLMMTSYEQWIILFHLLFGMFLSASGCAVLNQYLEKEFCIMGMFGHQSC